ncbi:hypothetical protein RND71_025083 [Anisodus tanguticus]|uniref:Uncharacterized protein n=1 Tax=Anisodus tanguticus TaxID=243964 RepID=A0AAE1RRL3_9SOLA|nr:hypothetical protein RND71_025083 [Anisodus tanguticus]
MIHHTLHTFQENSMCCFFNFFEQKSVYEFQLPSPFFQHPNVVLVAIAELSLLLSLCFFNSPPLCFRLFHIGFVSETSYG